MNKDYIYEYASLERNHWWFLEREKIIKRLLKQYLPQYGRLKILNIGAAAGRSSEMLAHFGHVTSVEYDVDFLQLLLKSKVEAIAASITNLPFNDNQYDLVCAFDVIEHIEDDSKAFSEMHRVCKNKGFVYITVPASPGLWSHHDVINNHFRRYSRESLLCVTANFKTALLLKISYFNFFLYPFIRLSRKLEKPNGKIKNSNNDFSKYKMFKKLFAAIFSLEKFIVPHFDFPCGVSLIAIYQKKESKK